MQRTMFATGTAQKPRKHADGQQRLEWGPFRQPALPMPLGADPGRRGEPDATWLDAVLEAYRATGRKQAPDLTAIQGSWDDRLNVADTVYRLTVVKDVSDDIRARCAALNAPNPFDACEFADNSEWLAERESTALAALNHKPPTALWTGPLALPKPLDAKSRAIALVGKGTSLRNGAQIMGVPVTTFRRLLGRVD